MDQFGGWREEGFESWKEYGYTSDYVSIDAKNKVIRPAWDASDMSDKGLHRSGTKVRFVDRNGYDGERERAAAVFSEDIILTVASCRIGQSSSDYEFEGYDGKWNTVMFEKCGDDA